MRCLRCKTVIGIFSEKGKDGKDKKGDKDKDKKGADSEYMCYVLR